MKNRFRGNHWPHIDTEFRHFVNNHNIFFIKKNSNRHRFLLYLDIPLFCIHSADYYLLQARSLKSSYRYKTRSTSREKQNTTILLHNRKLVSFFPVSPRHSFFALFSSIAPSALPVPDRNPYCLPTLARLRVFTGTLEMQPVTAPPFFRERPPSPSTLVPLRVSLKH